MTMKQKRRQEIERLDEQGRETMKQYEPLCPATIERIKGYIHELGYDVVTFDDSYRIVGKNSETVRDGVDDFGLVLFALGHLHETHVAFVKSISNALEKLK